MMDFSLKNNDLLIANGDVLLCLDDHDAIAQTLSVRLKTLAKEWFLDQNEGIPYLAQIFGKKHSNRFLKRVVLNAIRSTSGIESIKEFSLTESNTRTVLVTFSTVLSNKKTVFIKESIGV